ncbi:hypothetical protein OF83DRAFT_1145039, partial [Amylostereum chailletii]
MFSTLSSFLPSALQQQSTEDKKVGTDSPRPAEKPSQPAKTQPEQASSSVDEVGVVRRERKEKKNTQETFIVVRPPPAKNNHPLNLQVQLVPPQARDRSQRRSVDFSISSRDSGADDPNALARTQSGRSDVSSYSGYASVASFSSVASTSTTSSRRMIIPLYNLQAHNVMQNVIVDAGTDAKVSKFMRRGLEVIGLAVLEPLEVFGTNSSLAFEVPLSPSTRTSMDDRRDFIHSVQAGEHERPQTATSSVLSVSSAGTDPHATPVAGHGFPVPPAGAAPERNGAKKIFGKLFKKKDTAPAAPEPASPSAASFLRVPRAKAPAGQAKRGSWAPPPPAHAQEVSGASTTAGVTLQPAVLGLQPILSSPINPPRGRPHSYAWLVRRWIKGGDEGILGNVIGLVGGMGLSDDKRRSRMPEGGQVEVQFIWARGRKPVGGKGASASTKETRRRSTGGLASDPPSLSSLTHPDGKRASTDQHSISTGTSDEPPPSSMAGMEDSGDESDPEDSERPWTCMLVIRRVSSPGVGADARLEDMASPTDGHMPQTLIRMKVATFSPTPHHPKVVSLLKVPFPLPDIVVDQMIVHRRVVTPQGLARPSYDPSSQKGLVLTAEEIKDIVSSTGLWLVVRENIGGVGKVS